MENLNNEIWNDIIGYENFYKISSLGRIKSLPRKYKNINIKQEKILQPNIKNGYLVVSLCKNGKQTSHTVHRLVALALLPNPNKFNIINHIDGNKSNNNVNNLQWCTQSENVKHSYKTFLKIPLKGEEIHSAKLTEENVKNIYIEYFTSNCKMSSLAKKHNVDSATISNIIQHKTWVFLTKNLSFLDINRALDFSHLNNPNIEIWENVSGYEGYYQISNFGKVKSLERHAIGRAGKLRTLKEKIINLHDNGRGYLFAVLSINSKVVHQYIHRMVAAKFVPNPKQYNEVNHLDGNKNNNHFMNLVWCSPSDNQKHAWDTGLKTYKKIINEQ